MPPAKMEHTRSLTGMCGSRTKKKAPLTGNGGGAFFVVYTVDSYSRLLMRSSMTLAPTVMSLAFTAS